MIDTSLASLAVAGVFGMAAALLAAGALRAQRRVASQRRLAEVLDIGSPGAIAPDAASRQPISSALPSLDVTAALALARQHDTALRGPLLVLTCLAGLIGVFTLSWPWLVLAAVAAVAAYWLGGRLRRQRAFEAQSMHAIQLLSSGLRAGYSVPQAIALVSRNSSEPTASEFNLASQEISLGIGLAEALSRLAKRNANQDYALVSIIVGVQHEVGGNLAHILDSVSNTLRERIDLRRQVDALTAQQRMSSIVLTLLPFALLALLFVMDRSFVAPLFTETLGRLLLALSGVMVLIGWTIMRSIGRVEV